MNLKEFLSATKIIKESTLAALMWPDKKHSAKVFSNKINEIKAGSGKQRITEDDEARAKVVLDDIANQIKAYTDSPSKEPEIVKQPLAPPIEKKQATSPKKATVKEVKEPVSNKPVEKEPTIWEKMDKLREADKK